MERSARLSPLYRRVPLAFELAQPLLVRSSVLQRMVVAVDTDVLQHALIAQLDDLSAGGLCSEGRFEFGDAFHQDRRICCGSVHGDWRRRWVVGSMPATCKPWRRLRGWGIGGGRHMAGGRGGDAAR